MIPVFSIVAYSDTGKTTFVEKLLPILKEKGIRTAVVKHDSHGFEIDKEGKDSYRITKAGADITGIVSGDRSVLMENRPREMDHIFGSIQDVDLILTEGYKKGIWPKIMLHRSGTGKDLPLDPESCLAVVSDVPVHGAKNYFDLNDARGVADLLISKISETKTDKNPLSRLSFFQDMDKDTLDGLWKDGRIEQVPRNVRIIEAGKHTDYFYFQLTGISSIYTLTHTGSRKVISLIGSGTILNDAIINQRPSSVYCETYQESEIFVIPIDRFHYWMEKDYNLAVAVISMQDLRVKKMSHQLRNTVSNISIERRLASKLWKLARDFGKPCEKGTEINLNLPITFLADMLGVPRETASRACKRLIDEGLIRIEKKRILILDSDEIVKRFHNNNKK